MCVTDKGVVMLFPRGHGTDAEDRNGVYPMQIFSKWRTFNVAVVGGLRESYIIDDAQRQILIRRSIFRPWRMLTTLIDAMNAVADRDVTWAYRMNGEGNYFSSDTVKIAGETWKVIGCTVLADLGKKDEAPINLKPFVVDHDKREIRVNNRMNMATSAASLVSLVSGICDDKVRELTEKVEDVFESFRDGRSVAA